MTQFTPEPVGEEVNVTKVSPLKECIVLLASLVGICFVVYTGLGMILDFIIFKYPQKFERVLSKAPIFAKDETPEEFIPVQAKTRAMLDELVSHLPPFRSGIFCKYTQRGDR